MKIKINLVRKPVILVLKIANYVKIQMYVINVNLDSIKEKIIYVMNTVLMDNILFLKLENALIALPVPSYRKNPLIYLN